MNQPQMSQHQDVALVADASAVIDDAALQWLMDNRGTILASPGGRPLAVAVNAAEAERAAEALRNGGERFPLTSSAGEQFVRKLRRRVELGGYSVAEQSPSSIEKRLFANVYKGVTDLVTKWAWPWPAFHVTRLISRFGVTPNIVTLIGLVLVFVAGWLFYEGQFAAALAAAWLMTFLDTVDGKLARVTATSSKFGDKLDHGTDIIHPPIWWYCLAHGIAEGSPREDGALWLAFWIILGCYVVGRLVETAFKKRFGFNQYIWRPFDSRFRLIISRRNTILLIMMVGVALGAPAAAYLACAAWSIISTGTQLVRLLQAQSQSRRQPIVSWLT
jgi:phosphatidylglycerophosphate synthase